MIPEIIKTTHYSGISSIRINMGAQQVKEGRAPTSCNASGNLENNCNITTSNCSAANVPSGNLFGTGTSLRASRINKSKMLKETKSNILNIFTEHNGN